ncbi:hypothetical protein EI94DRAFT_1807558 [Lactarius quietus]|nr:hypothetical protein EI94DRAFT_1815292 [Lactarius quietus]KAF8263257.1 hypothetical protein EI94DRAFT_1807558 [Lactarius quietus]
MLKDKDSHHSHPHRADVHDLQAKRAISWWQTGEMIKPKKLLNEYSKANWGDHIKTREGRTIRITTTSGLVAIVLKLKDKQWDKIFAAAFASGRRKNLKKAVVAASTPESPQAALVELQDDDSDLSDH